MGKKIDFSNEQKRDIIDLYDKQGLSLTAIASKYVCSRSVIIRLLVDSGIKLKSRSINDKYKKVKQQDINIMIELYHQGYTYREIGNKFGISNSRVGQILRENNIERSDTKIKKHQYPDVVEMYYNGYTTDQIAQKYNCVHEVVCKILHRCGVQMRPASDRVRKYSFNEHYFDDIDTPNKAYILGLLYADGCNHAKNNGITLKLQERDKEVLEKINIELQNEKPLFFINLNMHNDKWQNAYEISLFSKHFANTLANKGVVPNKSFKLTFPTWLNVEFYSHFIRGYIDGDGCISKDVHRAGVYITGTKSFCESLANIFENMLGITSYHINIPCMAKENNTNTRVIQINAFDDAKKLLDWVYADANLYLQRKYDIYKSIYCNNTK